VSRILWISNAPWAPSGYGGQANLFVPRLQALGHEMAIGCNHGLTGAKLDWDGITCYPADFDWGNTTIHTYQDHHKADLTITLHDAWVMKPDAWPKGTRSAIWAPVDHNPLPAAVEVVLRNPNVYPIAMSRFGEKMMTQRGLQPVYVPHGIDTDVFKPQPENKAEIRKELGIPEDAFLIGMVAANQGNPSFSRKSFPQAFQAFARFAHEHEDAWLYAHTLARPTRGDHGINLEVLAVATGCPAGRLRFPPDNALQLGMTNTVVANIYAAFDVLLNPAMGEGFGVPIVEAQACGVPVIASDHSAMTELTHAGTLVSGDPFWDALQMAWFTSPSVDSIYAALEHEYARRDDMKLREAAVAFAGQYDADLVTVNYWEPALERLMGEWPSGRVVPPLGVNGNRAMRRKAAKAKVAP
jgi:glycosyltransferase involved in cell wall biosynthesis